MRADGSVLPFKKKKFALVFDKSGAKIAHLRVHIPTGVYYVRKTFKRYRIPELFESLGVTTIGKAKGLADERVKAHLDRWLGEKRTIDAHRFGATTIGRVIDQILAVYTPTVRKRTQTQHRLYLGELKKEWGQVDISRLTLETWTQWLFDFKKRKDRCTFNDYRKHMNIVLHYAHENHLLSRSLSLPNPDPKGKTRWRVLTQNEVNALFLAMNDDTRDQFLLAYQNYMRLREGLHLEWDRVNLETGEITLRPEDVKTGSQTGKGRSFYASPDARNRLVARFKRMGHTSAYVFPSPRNPRKPVSQNITAWTTAKKKAGIKGPVRWHDLRHTAITHALLTHKVDPIEVSEFAGVSIPTIQRVYLHSTAEKTRNAGQVLRVSSGKRWGRGGDEE